MKEKFITEKLVINPYFVILLEYVNSMMEMVEIVKYYMLRI